MVIPKKKKTSKKESSSNTKKSKKRKASSDLPSEDSVESSNYKQCRYHGKCTHTTEECTDIKHLVREDKKRKQKNRYDNNDTKNYSGLD